MWICLYIWEHFNDKKKAKELQRLYRRSVNVFLISTITAMVSLIVLFARPHLVVMLPIVIIGFLLGIGAITVTNTINKVSFQQSKLNTLNQTNMSRRDESTWGASENNEIIFMSAGLIYYKDGRKGFFFYDDCHNLDRLWSVLLYRGGIWLGTFRVQYRKIK